VSTKQSKGGRLDVVRSKTCLIDLFGLTGLIDVPCGVAKELPPVRLLFSLI